VSPDEDTVYVHTTIAFLAAQVVGGLLQDQVTWTEAERKEPGDGSARNNGKGREKRSRSAGFAPQKVDRLAQAHEHQQPQQECRAEAELELDLQRHDGEH
jgi:hypothetical protein